MKYFFILIFQVGLTNIIFGQSLYNINDKQNSFAYHFSETDSVPNGVKLVIKKVTEDLSKYIKSSILINIKVQWISQNNKNLASCSAYAFYSNFKNCPLEKYNYPIALAEKISNEEINGSDEPDIYMIINKNMNWYLGDDGNPSFDQADLYTILLHELCHGLGFQSNFVCGSNIGGLFGNNSPFIYDSFITNNTKIKLINTSVYKNNSIELYNALTSDSLLFIGPFTNIKSSGTKLYAPKIYNPNSSTSHLDNIKYPKDSINYLMTYAKKQGESIHLLGPKTEGILADIGWDDFILSTDKQYDVENISNSNTITVYADSIIDPKSLLLHYSFDYLSNELTIPFDKTNKLNYFKATIPTSPFEHTISYYITATDTLYKNTIGIPNNYPHNYYSFRVGKDTTSPEIKHQEILDISEDADSLLVKATITDNIGIDSAWVEYLVNSIDFTKSKKIKLIKTQYNVYQAYINLKNYIKQGDIFLYKIYAIDSSSNKNISKTSAKGYSNYYQITVSSQSQSFISLEDDFENEIVSNNRFTLNGFSVKKEIGFSSQAIQTTHPYPTAIYTGKTINFTATLKNPCTIRETNAYLDFDEIVLVEPSESGTVFGDYEFWDYCIIEGSKDKINWYAFEQKGYKTESYNDWMSTFYSETTTDENGKISSTASGNETLYHHHRVNLLGNKYLRKGDNVYIRFRLFSDAFQNGWGWSIDNLKIQSTSTLDSILYMNTNGLIIYPTISDGNFRLINQNNKIIKSMEAISLYGESIPCSYFNENSLRIKANNGIYFLKTIFEDGTISTNKIIINF